MISGRGNGGKGHLEQHEQIFRDDHALAEGDGSRIPGNAEQEQLAGAAPVGAGAAAEGKGIAIGDPDDHHQCAHHGALHQHRQHVLRPHQAAIEQAEPRHQHEQHQHGADEHEGRIPLVGDRDRRCGHGGGSIFGKGRCRKHEAGGQCRKAKRSSEKTGTGHGYSVHGTPPGLCADEVRLSLAFPIQVPCQFRCIAPLSLNLAQAKARRRLAFGAIATGHA